MEEQEFRRKYADATNAIQDRVKKRLGKEPVVTYSAYQADNDGIPIDNLDEVPIRGKVRLVLKCNEMFASDDGKDYESDVLDSPSWLDICVYADEALRSVGDTHHVFLEVLRKLETSDGVTVAHLEFGS